MFNIAKKLVKTFEQSVSDTLNTNSSVGNDSYFQSIPPNLLQYPGNYKPSIDTLHGLRVIQCDETQLQVHSFFDYIIGFNDEPLPLYFNTHGFPFPDFNEVYRMINTNVSNDNGFVKLNIWSGKGGVYRDVYLQLQQLTDFQDVSLDDPATAASQNGTQTVKPLFQKLGFQIQWQPLLASTFTYHILSITDPYGTAARSGLVPQTDYIIGCQDGLLSTGGETLLQDILQAKSNQDLVLYVYNTQYDFVRPITVSLNGGGKLGCNVGYGYLHRINAPQKEESSDPSSAFASNSEQSFLNDPSMTFQPMQFQQPMLPVGSTKKKKHHVHQQVSTNLLSDLQEKDPNARETTPSSSNLSNTTATNTSMAPPPIKADHIEPPPVKTPPTEAPSAVITE